jgi:hypothetical protein
VCLESKGDDAGLVGLVDPRELFGHLGPGDRRSRRVNNIDDELTAGEEAVRGEFSGTYRDGGRVILAKKTGERCVCRSLRSKRSRVGVASSRRARCHPALSNALFAHDPINSLLLPLITLRNDTHRHVVVLRCVICRFFEDVATTVLSGCTRIWKLTSKSVRG